MGSQVLRISPAGDSALVVDFSSADGRTLWAYGEAVRVALRGTPRVDVIAGYDSVLIRFDPAVSTVAAIHAAAESCIVREPDVPPRHFSIPVTYGNEAGPDLEAVAEVNGLQPAGVVRLHSSRIYTVRCIGFSPGFPYLDGLDPGLHTPRLETPRRLVAAGSVAIGGDQAGIYPTATPGGWRIIGRTPLMLFDSARQPPVPYSIGDTISFVPISPDELQCVDPRELFQQAERRE